MVYTGFKVKTAPNSRENQVKKSTILTLEKTVNVNYILGGKVERNQKTCQCNLAGLYSKPFYFFSPLVQKSASLILQRKTLYRSIHPFPDQHYSTSLRPWLLLRDEDRENHCCYGDKEGVSGAVTTDKASSDNALSRMIISFDISKLSGHSKRGSYLRLSRHSVSQTGTLYMTVTKNKYGISSPYKQASAL